MQYNIHPIIVHFPIALLCLYSIIKVLPLRKWLPRIAWKDIQLLLLVLGVLGACAALLTGDAAEEAFQPVRALVDAHSTFAAISTYLYGALLLGELSAVFNGSTPSANPSLGWLRSTTLFLAKVLCNPALSAILAVVALGCITVTGLLGGVMVYGTSADPLAGFVLSALGISL